MDARGLRALSIVLVVVCLVAAAVAPIGAAADPGSRPAALQAEDELALEDADQIVMDVFIAENGSALVTVDYQFRYGENGTSKAAWERLRTDVESDTEAYVDAERTKWNDTVADGANETGQNMSLSNLSIATENETALQRIGHVEVSFRWESFAAVEINQLTAGPALSGFTLDDDTRLQFRWPAGYSIYENDGQPQIDPSPSNRTDDMVIWRGSEVGFADERPWIVLIEDGGSNANTTATPSNEGPTMPWTIVVLALALLAAVGAGGWLLGRERTADNGSKREAERPTQPDGSTGSASNAADGPPPELLSNEERVLRLLEERGGRIKQQAVVSELGWTEAKTSQVVGDLREADEIEVFRIGRENVLSLPEEDEE
ncbi:helix-turn-helix transcriptional regulator [Natrinema sp. CGMCC1.2065]|uniref:helix-turn-helix transcriptional regulator n=1 Tax=Natrinema sp. CGMCC1.2065 TaxID=3445767 RepID=UPI003F4A6DC2